MVNQDKIGEYSGTYPNELKSLLIHIADALLKLIELLEVKTSKKTETVKEKN